MSKTLAVVLAVGIGGGAGVAAYAYLKKPERAACVRIADLCGEKNGTKDDLDRCVEEVEQWRKVAGDEPVDKGIQCVDDAKTCGEAMGCVAGAGIKGFQNVVDDFFKGLGKGLGGSK
ncbi:hypothetical protein [Polyangium sp. y55x31]|uniref:hypothetical protein n=1 Tax=Polyangium sp. y55x31 TaxID=3042688 RepID=UPI0024827846|nr:hypothetical protein [Polyangium sp. y55x31]MDI1484599.1 hypothetical protein [Polyangium sp. y55x31]